MEQIRVRKLSKSYTTFEQGHGLKDSLKGFFKRKTKIINALNEVSFSINKGELVGLIGPNGAGKSTTIKILCGILFPTSGEAEIKVAGKAFVPWKSRVTFVKNIGVVFGQKSQLWFDLPPIDTFYLNKSIYDIPDSDFERRMKYFSDLLDVKEVIKRPTRQLSLGERMKCELMAALLHGPSLVFLDEPTIGLDIIVKEKIRDFISEINKKEGITFILTTHDLQDIDRLCKRVIILDKGSIAYDGPLETLKKNYIKEKNIRVVIEKMPKKKFAIKGAKIHRQEGNDVWFRVPVSKVRDVTRTIVNNFELIDINITEPSIEQVIAHIYRKK
ncbi:MAG: ATP-binding cassette domain-containing protein [Nanoarchaeota archaeon]|nr:MAG: ATP-binding cassette domain-containing protein [Nanoarchaeota archaeon]